jgi:sulfur transfer complex TusBCD TusB component (DsrH family)
MAQGNIAKKLDEILFWENGVFVAEQGQGILHELFAICVLHLKRIAMLFEYDLCKVIQKEEVLR